MKKRFNQIIYSSAISSVVFIALGIVLLMSPDTAHKVIGYLVGTMILLSGFLSVGRYFLNNKKLDYFNSELIIGVLAILFGIYVLIKPLMITSFITMVLGLWVIISGLVKFQYALRLRNYKKEFWIVNLGVSLITLFVGIVLVLNPFKSNMLLTEIIGIFIILYGLLDILNSFILKQNMKTIINIIDSHVDIEEKIVNEQIEEPIKEASIIEEKPKPRKKSPTKKSTKQQ